MLDTSPNQLFQEIAAAEQLRDHIIASSEEMVSEYVGSHYRDDREPEQPTPRPFIFEWLSQLTPTIIFDNPRAEVSARASGAKRADLKRLQHGINRNLVDVQAWWILHLIWYDVAFSFGALRTTMEPIPGFKGDRYGRKPHRPTCHRIQPNHYIHDPRSGNNPQKARFRGHMWSRDKEDLLQDPRYDAEAVRAIAADAQMEKYYGKDSGYDYVPRNEILCYDVWVPEKQLDGYSTSDGYHGTIYTLATAFKHRSNERVQAQWIREPRPFFGPDTGPYELFGIYPVPNQVFPLSPLAAIREQVQELNTHSDAARQNAANHKQFIGVDPANPDAGKRVKDVKNGQVATIPGLQNGSVQQMEIGGTTEQQFSQINYLTERLERASGLTDAALGVVTGDGTATEQAQAEAARGDRIEYMANMYQNSVAAVLQRFGWYIWHSQHVDFELGPEAIEDLAPRPSIAPDESEAEQIAIRTRRPLDEVKAKLEWNPQLWLRRGTPGGFPSANSTFSQAMIRIEPLSMQRTSEPLLQKRKMEWLNLITKVAPLVRQYPEVDWVTLLDQVGQTFNQKDAGELINEQLAHQLGGYGELMQQQQQPAGAPSGNLEELLQQVQGGGQANDQRTGILAGAQAGSAARAG